MSINFCVGWISNRHQSEDLSYLGWGPVKLSYHTFEKSWQWPNCHLLVLIMMLISRDLLHRGDNANIQVSITQKRQSLEERVGISPHCLSKRHYDKSTMSIYSLVKSVLEPPAYTVGFTQKRRNSSALAMELRLFCINSSPTSAAYMRQWTGSALVQVMACRLLSPLPVPMLAYCQLDSWEKFQWNSNHFH